MSGLSRQQFSTSDLENYLVESNQEWSKIAVAQYLTTYWGSSHYEAADMAAQLPNPRELVDRATKTVHLKKGDQEISYRVIREDLLNGLKEQYPLVADAMDRLVQRRLSNRGTSGWLYLPADRDFNVFVNQLERNAKRKLVQADLAGEALYNFRTGAELYPYCPQCVYVTQAPRGDLGCTKGDDPSVLDYSSRLTAGEADPETEKCPMFSPAAVAQEIAKRTGRKIQAARTSPQQDAVRFRREAIIWLRATGLPKLLQAATTLEQDPHPYAADAAHAATSVLVSAAARAAARAAFDYNASAAATAAYNATAIAAAASPTADDTAAASRVVYDCAYIIYLQRHHADLLPAKLRHPQGAPPPEATIQQQLHINQHLTQPEHEALSSAYTEGPARLTKHLTPEGHLADEAEPVIERAVQYHRQSKEAAVLRAVEQNTAGMFKDLTPMGIAPASLESPNWEEMLEDAVDRVKKNPEDTQALLIIDRAASEILSDEHQALNVKVQDYDQYHEDNSIKKKQT